jgi:molybdopterin synthase sulfur carrier subunit
VRQDGGPALTVAVRLATALRSHADGRATVAVEVVPPATLRTVLDALAAAHPSVGRRVRDESGALRRHVNVFVGTDNAKDLEGLDTPVAEGTEVSVLAAVSGGADR